MNDEDHSCMARKIVRTHLSITSFRSEWIGSVRVIMLAGSGRLSYSPLCNSVMASIPCMSATHLCFTPKPSNSQTSVLKFNTQFLGIRKNLGCFRPSNIGPSNGYRAKCWFKFGKNGVDAEGAGIYGSQSRDDFDRDDVEQYFNYMGMLAVEGSYDKMEALLNLNIHPVDILLMMAASEGDKPKLEELLRAGANYDVKDADGRTALDRATTDEIKNFILSFSVQKA